MATAGDTMQERRRNWAYVTGNTEYHTRNGKCVAVRDVCNARWVEQHRAIGMELFGSLEASGAEVRPRFGEAVVGEALLLVGDHAQLVTSEVWRVYRPSRETVSRQYPDAQPLRSWAKSHTDTAFRIRRTSC